MFSAPPPATLSKCRGSLSVALAHEERKFSRLATLCPFKQSHVQDFCACVWMSEWFSNYVSNCLLKWACLQPRCHIGPVNLAVFTLRPCWSSICPLCARALMFAHVRHIPTFICLFDYFVWLHSLFFCHFQSCRPVSQNRLRPCVCARSVRCTTKAQGQLVWRDAKWSLGKGREMRKRDGCVLFGIPKNLYDLNDKRTLSHA